MSHSSMASSADADKASASNREEIVKGLNEDLSRDTKRSYSMLSSVLL